jgi:phosphoribosylaminoimidazolecarboxamide formyltransferase/IMP cyclohydrolase
MAEKEIRLRYGTNPHQTPARIYAKNGDLPLKVLNGAPGYINLLDALNAWQLVRELKAVVNLPAAASFKHTSPAGVGIGLPLSDVLRQTYFVGDLELSPLAAAYARARGADRMSSFGDWAALSDTVDESAAKLLSREFSDGIIAPGYTPEALDILKKKKSDKYVVLEIDPTYNPPEIESRDVFGLTFEQRRNDAPITAELLQNIVTKNRELPLSAQQDLLISLVTLKYTQSNSVCFALGGQIIGNGAGQQSRIHCTRLAAAKADTWYLRQHPTVLNLQFKAGIKRADRDNAIDQYLINDLTPAEEAAWRENFDTVPKRLTIEEKHDWLHSLSGVSMGSDAFIPFRDNVDRGQRSGVKYIVQTGGSMRDDLVIEAADEYGMVMVMCGLRLFHH